MGSTSWLLTSLAAIIVVIFPVACGHGTPDTPHAEPTAHAALMPTDSAPAEPTAVNTIGKVFTAPTAAPTNVTKDVSATILGTAAPAPRISEGSPPPRPSGVVSIEELYLGAEYVVRVELVTTTVATTTLLVTHPATGAQWTTWCIFLNFSFRTIDYLKGSGPGEITAVAGQCGTQEWLEGPGVAEVVGYHDTRWDDRQAIVFLKRYAHLHGAYAFMNFIGGGGTNYYQITSDIAKTWLPAAHSSDGVGTAASSTDPIYLLDAPATSSSSGGAGRVAAPPPTISLSALKTKLADLEAQASLGGTAEYRLCVEHYYYRVRLARYKRDSEFEPYPIRYIHGIESGQPRGRVLHGIPNLRGRSEENLGRYWFEGPDPDVVRFSPTDFVPDGNGVWFTQNIVTSRPLPAGDYEYYSNGIPPGEVDCNLYPVEERTHVHHRLTVTTPEGVVHEAFFDPVDIGDAVGADGSSGVLEPADFSLGGVTTTIASLKWENGTVTMGLSPAASLSGNIIDFIDVTGTTTLSLSLDDATRSGSATLTWSVADQPWEASDLIMLRISASADP